MPGQPLRRYYNQILPDNLASRGPLISLTLRLPEAIRKLRQMDPQITAKALIDTGAEKSCISNEIAKQLSLTPAGKIRVLGATGAGESYQYSVDFTFTDSDILFEDWPVFGVDIREQQIEMLIGRDILKVSQFIYNGSTGEIGMEIPGRSDLMKGGNWIRPPAKAPRPAITTPNPSEKKKKKIRRRVEKTSRKKQRSKK